MYDPKFEKEVQRKMEELQFSPSDAVWMNIERAVVQEKKRRVIPFFWFFVGAGLVLTGTGFGYLLFGTKPAKMAASIPLVNAKPSLTHSRSDNSVTQAQPVISVIIPKKMVSETAGSRYLSAPLPLSIHAVSNKRPTIGSHPVGLIATESSNHLNSAADAGITPELNRGSSPSGKSVGMAGTDSNQVQDISNGSGSEKSAIPHIRYTVCQPGVQPVRLSPPNVLGSNLLTSTNRAFVRKPGGINVISVPSRAWEAGFEGGVGISSLTQPFFTQASTAPLAFNTNVLSPVSGTNGAQRNYLSRVQPDFSFSAGILARKPISDRWAGTVGLRLHYYSAQLHIGQQVPLYSPLATSLFNSPTAAPIQTYPYFPTGNEQTFINRYYFLEIPASIQWQINRSRIWPIWWEGGATFSYLMSSDALYYNAHSGVYFKDAGVIHKAQFNISTSLLVGLSLGGLRLQAGPQVQYGLTPLLNTQTAGDQHLLFAGLRLVLMPGKRK